MSKFIHFFKTLRTPLKLFALGSSYFLFNSPSRLAFQEETLNRKFIDKESFFTEFQNSKKPSLLFILQDLEQNNQIFKLLKEILGNDFPHQIDVFFVNQKEVKEIKILHDSMKNEVNSQVEILNQNFCLFKSPESPQLTPLFRNPKEFFTDVKFTQKWIQKCLQPLSFGPEDSYFAQHIGIPNSKSFFISETYLKGSVKSEIEEIVRFFMGQCLVGVDDQFFVFSKNEKSETFKRSLKSPLCLYCNSFENLAEIYSESDFDFKEFWERKLECHNKFNKELFYKVLRQKYLEENDSFVVTNQRMDTVIRIFQKIRTFPLLMISNVNSLEESSEKILEKMEKVSFLNKSFNKDIYFLVFQNQAMKEMFKVNNIGYSESFWLYKKLKEKIKLNAWKSKENLLQTVKNWADNPDQPMKSSSFNYYQGVIPVISGNAIPLFQANSESFYIIGNFEAQILKKLCKVAKQQKSRIFQLKKNNELPEGPFIITRPFIAYYHQGKLASVKEFGQQESVLNFGFK